MHGDDALEFFVRTLLAQTETIERPLADTLFIAALRWSGQPLTAVRMITTKLTQSSLEKQHRYNEFNLSKHRNKQPVEKGHA
jgi:hypothetical protein